MIQIREKRIGEWLFRLCSHNHDGIHSRYNRGGVVSLRMVGMKLLVVTLLTPHLTIDVLKPDDAFLIFDDLCHLLQFTNHVPGIRRFIDGIYTVDLTTQDLCTKVKEGVGCHRRQLPDGTVGG